MAVAGRIKHCISSIDDNSIDINTWLNILAECALNFSQKTLLDILIFAIKDKNLGTKLVLVL